MGFNLVVELNILLVEFNHGIFSNICRYSYLLKDLLRAFRTARGEVRDPAECGTTLYNKLLPVAKFL